MSDPRIPPIPYTRIAEDIADAVFEALDRNMRKKNKLPGRLAFRAALIGTVAKYIEGRVNAAYRMPPEASNRKCASPKTPPKRRKIV